MKERHQNSRKKTRLSDIFNQLLIDLKLKKKSMRKPSYTAILDDTFPEKSHKKRKKSKSPISHLFDITKKPASAKEIKPKEFKPSASKKVKSQSEKPSKDDGQVHFKRHGFFKRLKRNKTFHAWTKSLVPGWHNFLYFINLRPTPYDQFQGTINFSDEDAKVLKFQRHIIGSINSVIIFLLSYVLVYLTYQLAVIFTSAAQGIDTVLYYYEVMFPIGNASPLWTPMGIIAITLSGPIVSLVLGLLYYRYGMRSERIKGLGRLFFLWMAFHSFNMFFGAFVAGVVTDQGFGYVANWLYMGIVLKIFFSLVALFVLTYFGYRATPWVLSTSTTRQIINRYNRNYFILTQMLIPLIVGGALLLWIKIPNRLPQHENIMVYDSIILGALLFLVLPAYANWSAVPHYKSEGKARSRGRFGWIFLVSAVLMILLYRFGLQSGLHFIIKIIFSITPY
ncbi:MAG: hypothetical protein Q7J34_14225 [Bacteroidales bacterium]|nr:hypothetical protein [Bacteroidales bacterium]